MWTRHCKRICYNKYLVMVSSPSFYEDILLEPMTKKKEVRATKSTILLARNFLTCSLTPDCTEVSSPKTTRNEKVVKQLRIISLLQSNRVASNIATCWQDAVIATTRLPKITTYHNGDKLHQAWAMYVHSLILEWCRKLAMTDIGNETM